MTPEGEEANEKMGIRGQSKNGKEKRSIKRERGRRVERDRNMILNQTERGGGVRTSERTRVKSPVQI